MRDGHGDARHADRQPYVELPHQANHCGHEAFPAVIGLGTGQEEEWRACLVTVDGDVLEKMYRMHFALSPRLTTKSREARLQNVIFHLFH